MSALSEEIRQIADGFVARQPLRPKEAPPYTLDYSARSLTELDAYLQVLHEIGPDDADEDEEGAAVRGAACYFGEVIRLNMPFPVEWVTYEDAKHRFGDVVFQKTELTEQLLVNVPGADPSVIRWMVTPFKKVIEAIASGTTSPHDSTFGFLEGVLALHGYPRR
jgi:hypothetical protein